MQVVDRSMYRHDHRDCWFILVTLRPPSKLRKSGQLLGLALIPLFTKVNVACLVCPTLLLMRFEALLHC